MTIAVANMQKGKYYTLEIAVPTVVYDNCDMEQSGIGFIIDRDNNTSNENYYYTGEIIAENLIRYTYLCTEDGTHYIHVGGMLTAIDDELATTATITFDQLQLTAPTNVANVTIPYTYRYGFNGQERQDELYGSGNAYDFGARVYDSRIGRFFSKDPLEKIYPSISTYAFVANSPLAFF